MDRENRIPTSRPAAVRGNGFTQTRQPSVQTSSTFSKIHITEMLARVTILLTFLAVALAAPLTPDPEMVASQRIAVLQKQYQQNTLHLIAAATTGCTAENIRRRKEW
jgi:hypothetical protein